MKGNLAVTLLALAALAAPRVATAQQAGGGAPTGEVRQPGRGRSRSPTVAVCQDASAHRCWLARTAAECVPAPGRLFRLVISEPGHPDVADALAVCRDTVRP